VLTNYYYLRTATNTVDVVLRAHSQERVQQENLQTGILSKKASTVLPSAHLVENGFCYVVKSADRDQFQELKSVFFYLFYFLFYFNM